MLPVGKNASTATSPKAAKVPSTGTELELLELTSSSKKIVVRIAGCRLHAWHCVAQILNISNFNSWHKSGSNFSVSHIRMCPDF